MGKGKRNRDRNQRTGHPAGEHPSSAGTVWFDAGEQTAETLGAAWLELAANLWPVDCQTCGRALGTDRPSLYVADLVQSRRSEPASSPLPASGVVDRASHLGRPVPVVDRVEFMLQ